MMYKCLTYYVLTHSQVYHFTFFVWTYVAYVNENMSFVDDILSYVYDYVYNSCNHKQKRKSSKLWGKKSMPKYTRSHKSLLFFVAMMNATP